MYKTAACTLQITGLIVSNTVNNYITWGEK